MTITGTIKTKVEIARKEVRDIFSDYFNKIFNYKFKVDSTILKPGEKFSGLFVDDGKICIIREYATSHRWDQKEVVIEEPTEEQIELIDMYKKIKKIERDYFNRDQ